MKKFMKFIKTHKKLSMTVGIVVGLLIVLRLSLGVIVQTAAAKVAPMVTGAPVTIGNVSLGLLEGYVALDDVAVGNPPGYTSPNAVTVKRLVFNLGMTTLFSEKIRIEEITVDGVNLYYEQKLTSNNLSDLQNNLKKFAGEGKKSEQTSAEAEPEKSAPKKLQIDKLSLTGISMNLVIAGTPAPIPVIPIVLENLGSGPDGITATDATAVVLDKLTLGGLSAAGGGLKDAGSAVYGTVKDTGTNLLNLFDSKK